MKKLTRVLLVILVIIIIVAVAGVLFLDSIARKGIEYGTGYATGVDTSLDRVHIGLFNGQVTLGNLQIDNPEGFETPFFMKLGDGHIDVSLGSLRNDTVEVPTVTLSDIHMYLEKTKEGENYKVIMKNLQRLKPSEGEEPPAEASEEKEEKRFVIREAVVKNVDVDVELFTLGEERKSLKVNVPEIRLTNLGTDSEKGVVLSQMTGVLIRSILLAVVQQSGDLLPAAMLNGLEDGLSGLKGLGDAGIEVVKGVGAKLDETGKQLEEGAKNLGEGVKDLGDKTGDALKGLGDAFKPKENEEEQE